MASSKGAWLVKVTSVSSKTHDAICQHAVFKEGDLFGVPMPELCQYVVFLGDTGWPIAVWQEIKQTWYGNQDSSTFNNLRNMFDPAVPLQREKIKALAKQGAAVLVMEKLEDAINGG